VASAGLCSFQIIFTSLQSDNYARTLSWHFSISGYSENVSNYHYFQGITTFAVYITMRHVSVHCNIPRDDCFKLAIFAGHMLFPMPSQQYQCTEGNTVTVHFIVT